jgi:hypothetical protein
MPAQGDGSVAKARPDLSAALGCLVAEAGDYARLRSRAALRATLKRVADEAAVALPSDLRQRIDRALSSRDDAATPLLAWLVLLAEARRALEADAEARISRVRDSIRRSGALVEPKSLGKLLPMLGEELSAVPDLGAVLDRRRLMSLVENDIERRESDIRRRWGQERAAAEGLADGDLLTAADTALAGGDLLPVAQALDEVAARKAAEVVSADPLDAARAGLERARESARDFLTPQESDWARRALATCPGAAGDASEAARMVWTEALTAIQSCLAALVSERKKEIERHERFLGEAASAPVSSGYARLALLIESVAQRQSVAEGGREAAERLRLEAEWELSRAVWEDGAHAGASALLAARRTFFDCHRAKDLPEAQAVAAIARSTSLAAARIRIEASWRRRWLLRNGQATPADRRREIERLGGWMAAELKDAPDQEVEARCRETEANLRASVAVLCVRSGSDGRAESDITARARHALESGEPVLLESVVREIRG